MSEGEESSRFIVWIFLEHLGLESMAVRLLTYICTEYAKFQGRSRCQKSPERLDLRSRLLGAIQRSVGLIYWKESSRLRAVCRKRLIILFALSTSRLD